MQYIVNTLTSFAVIGLIALSFSIIYRVVPFLNVLHGALLAVGGYSAYWAMECFSLPVFAAVGFSCIAAGGIGLVAEICVFRKIRTRTSEPLMTVLASLGLFMFIENLIALVAGNEIKEVLRGPTESLVIFFGARITQVQCFMIAAVFAAQLLYFFFQRYSRYGIEYRAVSLDQRLAEARGFDVGRIQLIAFTSGSAFAGFAGALVVLDVNLVPTMGMRLLLPAVVAVIVGGRSEFGPICGAAIIAGVDQLSVIAFGGEWRGTSTFIVLILFLFFRPEGILNKKFRRS